MVLDTISNYKTYAGLSERIAKGLEYLATTDLESLAVGKYEIEGKEIYANVSEYNSKELSNGKWEAHKNYIDIQYIVEGAEQMGYANISKFTPNVEYNPAKDVVFGTAEGDLVAVNKEMFAIFFPQDAHMPSIAIGESKPVKKVVVKILV